MHFRIAILFSIPVLITCEQFYFPGETPQTAVKESQNVNANLSILERGTETYENFVDLIIARGVSKLTLAIDNSITVQNQLSDAIVYSPVSIAGALALVLLGASGKTFDEITTVMGLATGLNIQSRSQLVHEHLGRLFLKLDKTSGFEIGVQINFASAIFIQDDYPIRSIYKQASESIYRSEILNLDFRGNGGKAQNVINKWVSDRTNSKIKDILANAPPSETKVVIASALYFKGAWEKPFFDGSTKRRAFFTNGRDSPSTAMVEMMSNGGAFPYYKDTILNCEILGFPYKGNQTTMYVILPNHSTKEVLKTLENALNPTELERLVENAKYTQAVVLFPKMKLESTVNLKGPLEYLGVRSLFNPVEANLGVISPGIGPKQPEEKAITNNDILIFSRMGGEPNRTAYGRTRAATETIDSVRQYLDSHSSPNPGLYADQVLHKVYMDITESGTEAAAATSVSLSRDGGRVSFRVDVPFLFFIRNEETKLVLFWGSVKTPTPSF